MSDRVTPIFLLVKHSKVVSEVCLRHKDGTTRTDEDIVKLLVEIIESIDREQLTLGGVIKEMEAYLLEKYGDIYDSNVISK